MIINNGLPDCRAGVLCCDIQTTRGDKAELTH